MAMTQLSGSDPTVEHRGVKCKQIINFSELEKCEKRLKNEGV